MLTAYGRGMKGEGFERRDFVPWQCPQCSLPLPFPCESLVACPRCAAGASGSVVAALVRARVGAADDAARAHLDRAIAAWQPA